MRRLALISLLAACAPDEREAVNETLPDGVFEPVPGASVVDASLVVDDDTVWWAYTRRGDSIDQVWLAATTTTGREQMTATIVDPVSFSYMPDVALHGEHVVVAMQSGLDELVRVRAFDADGLPLTAEPQHVDVLPAGESGPVGPFRLVSHAGGSFDLLSGVSTSAYEVAVAPLDADYRGSVETRIGMPEQGGEVPYVFTLAAVERSDGSLVVGWDRIWEQCSGPHPAMSLTTSVDNASVGAIQPVHDVPERGESHPSIAAADDSIYVAWVTDFYDSRARIALARYPDIGNVLVELGDPMSYNSAPALALAGPMRGAIAWLAADTNTVSVVGFEDSGSAILVGEPRVFEPVTLVSVIWTRLVHLDSERYLLAWIETNGGRYRLYARAIDLAGEPRARPVPIASTAPAPPRVLARPPPCSH